MGLRRSNGQSGTTINDAPECVQLRLCKLTWFFSAYGLKIRAYLQNLRFRKQKSVFPVSLGIMTKVTGVMLKRLAPYRKLHAVPGKPLCEPTSHSHLGHAPDDLGGLTGVVKALAGLFVNIRFRFHPGIMRSGCREVIRKFSKLFKALPGLLVARDPGTALTGSVPAFLKGVPSPHGHEEGTL
jgi:hypothetical protein